ncbi:MAG: hypothetical protein JNL39_19680 [Opitutaceae bacterium]|nr:hypothetical protein [Opitutaceae bacterium]
MNLSPPIATRSAWRWVPVAAALLALRKPWALHTPQLWAEDGSIFLQQDDEIGSRAIITPYNGYLHLLPRLIAWLASRAADVAWWPAIYNGLAFAITVGVFARLASARIALPHKPWLMLALPLTVSSAEPIINVTNLQSVTPLFLLLQLFAAPAANAGQRAGDLTLLVLAGLNGPFAILFAPLFAWRAWRNRGADSALACGAIAACTTTQGLLLARAGVALHTASEPLNPDGFLAVAGARLVSWPLFGPAAVRGWPASVHAVLALAVVGALVWRAVNATHGRAWRTTVAIVFALLLTAGLSRARTDLWSAADMANGDRYFFLPRVLLLWLLVAECFAPERAVAWLARGLGVLGLTLNAPHCMLPAPPDYRWAEHCDPIRRGVRADIKTLPEGWWIEYQGRPQKK